MQPVSNNIFHNAIIITATLLIILVASGIGFGQTSASKTGAKGAKAMMAPPNLDQCANGAPSGAPLACTGAQWQNGNLNSNNSQWVEGQAVPYRLQLTGLTVGAPATYTLEWDTTVNGKHAIDYLMTYNAFAPGANPCSGIASCDINAGSTFDIPEDPRVRAGQDGVVGTADDLTQKPGALTAFGGAIVSLSTYRISGTYAGSSSTAIDVTVIPTQSSMVLAWSGHISTRLDWGIVNSAVQMTGSPYHMRSITGGNQDRSMSLDSIIFPGKVTIVKEIRGLGGATSSETAFSYTATNFGTNGFTLVDTNVVGPDRVSKDIVVASGSSTVTITEADTPGWNLTDIKCSSSSGGLANIDNNSIAGNTMTLLIEEAEIVTCTSTSDQLGALAANVSISGFVTTQKGFGIKGATVSVFNPMTLETFVGKTNNFGRYSVDNLPAGDFYIVTVSHSRYVFPYATQSLTLDDALENMNFVSRQ